MPAMIDLTGQRFGRLVVLQAGERTNDTRRRTRWLCICDCGTEKLVLTDLLRSGGTKSCGCLEREARITHGMSRTPEYQAWQKMWDRCTNPNNKKWTLYGGRGITVCDAWKDFAVFIADMGERPTSGHSIDRIDGDGNYEPGNCRWATIHEQNNNRNGNVLLTWQGETMTLTQWGRKIGVCKETMHKRRRLGWTVERIVTTPASATRLGPH